MKASFISLVLIFWSIAITAQTPAIIKTVGGSNLVPNDKSQEGWKSNFWNGKFFYQGTGSPLKLCVTDGTNAGTQFISNLGSATTLTAAIPAKDFMFIITSRIVTFSPITVENQIWRSDGTAAGTSLVYTMPAAGTSNTNQFTSDRDAKKNFSVSENVMYFNGYTTAEGSELWVTDGTTAGTKMMKDIKTGTGSSTPFAFCKIGADVFFTATAVGFERKLWKTDGSEAGTVQVAVAEPFFILDNAVGIVNNKMIFYAHNTVDGYEPYVSDGTAAGTYMLKNINPSGNSWLTQSQNAHLRFTEKYCFFIANNGTHNALWRTDGTTEETIQLSEPGLPVQSGVSGGSYTETDANNIWLIDFNVNGSTEKLYKSDGTAAGTQLVTGNLSYAQNLKLFKGALWMQSRNTASAANTEPWRSDGTAGNTKKAFEINTGDFSSDPFGFFELNNKLYFFATPLNGNMNLYQWNGDFTFNGSVAGGNWKDSANWNSSMPPGITDSVYVNAGTPNPLVINNTKGFAGTLILGNNASIEITNGSDSLYIATELSPLGNNSFTGSGILVSKSFSAKTVQFKSGFTANSISIESNTILKNGTVAVNKGMTLLGGKLTLNTGNLIMKGNTSAVTALNNNYVVTNGTGTLQVENIGAGARTGEIIFPVGNTTYNPVSFSNNGTADMFGVRVAVGISNSYTGETPGILLTGSAVNRTWFLTEATAGGSNASITLQWNATDELPGFDRNNTSLGHYTGGSWITGNTGTASGTNPYTFSRTGITSFSPFGIFNNLSTPVSNLIRNTIHLNVFPNPANDRIQVALTTQMQNESLSLQLFTANGQKVMQQSVPAAHGATISINLKSLSQGIYFLHLKGKTVNASAVINKIR
ncbi:MAG: T9SS type A sorting domain-containing protein [Chitinophagaceae bacterium]